MLAIPGAMQAPLPHARNVLVSDHIEPTRHIDCRKVLEHKPNLTNGRQLRRDRHHLPPNRPTNAWHGEQSGEVLEVILVAAVTSHQDKAGVGGVVLLRAMSTAKWMVIMVGTGP